MIKHVLNVLLIIAICNSEKRDDTFKYKGNAVIKSSKYLHEYYYWVYENGSYTSIEPIQSQLEDDDVFFPKCCPPGHVYNNYYHSCVESDEPDIYVAENLDVNLIQTGLSGCSVMVDHYLNDSEVLWDIIDENATAYYVDESKKLDEYCVDKNTNGTRTLRICMDKSYIYALSSLTTVRKCCDDGEVFAVTYELERQCFLAPNYGINVKKHSIDAYPIAIHIHDLNCKLKVVSGKNYTLYLHQSNYCFEYTMFVLNGITYIESILYMCELDLGHDQIARMISSVCLVITIVIYVTMFWPKKIIHLLIISYSSALFLAFTTNVFAFLWFNGLGSHVLTNTYVFCYFASIAWTNVTCFEIYKGITKNISEIPETTWKMYKKYIIYSIYAWTTAGFFFIIYYVETKTDALTTSLKIAKKYVPIAFFYIPFTMLIVISAIIFIMTVRKIIVIKRDIVKMKNLHADEKEKNNRIVQEIKQQLFLIIKLHTLLGIHWISEAILKFFEANNEVYGLVIIAIDNLQGFFVFMIFVLKWEYIQAVCRYIGNLNRPNNAK